MWYKIKQWNNFWFLFYVSRIGNNYSVDEIFYCYSMLWICLILTHFIPLISFDTPWNIRKLLVFWCFQGVSKEISGTKWVNAEDKKIRFLLLIHFVSSIPFYFKCFWVFCSNKYWNCSWGFHLFHVTGLFLYPFGNIRNQRLSDVFRGYRKTSDMI